MKTVINLSSNESWAYEDSNSDLFAVCNTYCLNNNLYSWFYAIVSNKMDYTESLPIKIGDKTIACGDYCIVKSDTPELKLY